MFISGLSLQTLAIVLGSVAALRGIQIFFNYRRLLQSIHHLPGLRTLFHPSSVFSFILPPTSLTLGNDFTWLPKHTPFVEKGLDIISSITLWPKPYATLWIADAKIIKDIVWSRTGFPKPLEHYEILKMFGDNIVASEGAQWRRHRKIVAPAFSERTNRLVWDATTKIMHDLFETVWTGKNEIVVDHGVDLTLPIALFVIGAAGFGRPISWTEDDVVPSGHQMSFKDALHAVTQDIYIKVLVPTWAMGFTKRFRRARLAFEELQLYLTEMIKERKGSQEDDGNLLSNLLAANDDVNLSKDEVKLTNSELIGNIFILMVAGHETTAHTFSFAFALLALYPDKQEEFYQQVKHVVPDGRFPSFDDMPSLTYASASVFFRGFFFELHLGYELTFSLLAVAISVLNEALRMFPPVIVVPKRSAEDTTFELKDANGTNRTVMVPRGMGVDLDTPGLHYNPKYWQDPYSFKPERFLGDWNRDAFIPFSSGYRACVGKKFAETEAAAVLSIMVSRYTISIKEEPQFSGESFEQREARVLNAQNLLTLTPTRVPLVFRRRV